MAAFRRVSSTAHPPDFIAAFFSAPLKLIRRQYLHPTRQEFSGTFPSARKNPYSSPFSDVLQNTWSQ